MHRATLSDDAREAVTKVFSESAFGDARHQILLACG
jgi:hypothetical protein